MENKTFTTENGLVLTSLNVLSRLHDGSMDSHQGYAKNENGDEVQISFATCGEKVLQVGWSKIPRASIRLRNYTSPTIVERVRVIPKGVSVGPSERGSRNCRSGSLASGGNRPYCTCDTCF